MFFPQADPDPTGRLYLHLLRESVQSTVLSNVLIAHRSADHDHAADPTDEPYSNVSPSLSDSPRSTSRLGTVTLEESDMTKPLIP